MGKTDFALFDIETNSHLPGVYIGSSRDVYSGDKAVKRSIKIRCVSLDQAASDYNLPLPDLIKLDIEGAELFALSHMDYLAGKIRPKLILELHNPECDQKAWEFANRFGYRLTTIDTGRVLAKVEDVTGTLLCEPI